MNIGDNINALYGMWKMHCLLPRAYRFFKAFIQTYKDHK